MECFREAAQRIRRPRIEHVEVPYEGTSLPALFVHPEGRPRQRRGHPLSKTIEGEELLLAHPLAST